MQGENHLYIDYYILIIDGINIEWCMNGSVLIMTSRFCFSPHHDTLITLTYLPALGPSHAHANLADDLDSGNGKYISCSKDGMLVFWGPEFQPQRTVLVSFNHPFKTLFSRFLKCHIRYICILQPLQESKW